MARTEASKCCGPIPILFCIAQKNRNSHNMNDIWFWLPFPLLRKHMGIDIFGCGRFCVPQLIGNRYGQLMDL